MAKSSKREAVEATDYYAVECVETDGVVSFWVNDDRAPSESPYSFKGMARAQQAFGEVPRRYKATLVRLHFERLPE